MLHRRFVSDWALGRSKLGNALASPRRTARSPCWLLGSRFRRNGHLAPGCLSATASHQVLRWEGCPAREKWHDKPVNGEIGD